MHPTPLQPPAAQPDLRTTFAAFVAEFKAARPHKFGPRPEPVKPAPQAFDIKAARAELEQLQASHDATYNHSDDYTFWRTEQAKADRIASLRGSIARYEALGVAHG
jgi:hypothetical protein